MTAEQAWQALQDALTIEAPACEGDDRFVGVGTGGRVTSELREICDACPLLDLCAAYVDAETPRNLAGFWARSWRTTNPRPQTII